MSVSQSAYGVEDLPTRVQALEEQAKADQQLITNLKIALQSARRIGAAVGILMMSQRITDDEAFRLLQVASDTSHRKLRDVAETVLETRAPPRPPRPRAAVADRTGAKPV